MRRGVYIDTTNGDMWAQCGTDEVERWRWINGGMYHHVPKENLEFYDTLPSWY